MCGLSVLLVYTPTLTQPNLKELKERATLLLKRANLPIALPEGCPLTVGDFRNTMAIDKKVPISAITSLLYTSARPDPTPTRTSRQTFSSMVINEIDTTTFAMALPKFT